MKYLNKLLDRQDKGETLLDDEEVDKELTEDLRSGFIKDGFVSEVSKGRYIKVMYYESGGFLITQYSHHLQKQMGDKSKPTTLNLTKETFFLILEAMEFAEKRFKLNRKEAISKLTNGRGIDFNDVITGL